MMCFDFYLCVTSEGLVSIGAKFMFFLVASPFSWSLWKNLFLDIYAGHVILYWETLFCLDWSQPLVLLPLLFMVLSHSFASAGFYFFKYLPTYQLPSIFISSFVPNLIEYYNEHHFQFVDFFFQRTDSSWKKSSSRYIMTSYFQPLLLWTGAMLICRFVCFWIDKYSPPKVLIVLIMALFVSGH